MFPQNRPWGRKKLPAGGKEPDTSPNLVVQYREGAEQGNFFARFLLFLLQSFNLGCGSCLSCFFIFEASASSLVKLSSIYSVAQPNSDLATNLTNFCLLLSKEIPSFNSSFALPMFPHSKAFTAAELLLINLRLKGNCCSLRETTLDGGFKLPKNNFKVCQFKFPVMLKTLSNNEIQYLLFLASLHPQNVGKSLPFHSLKAAQKL